MSDAVLTEEAQALVDAMPEELQPLVPVRYAATQQAIRERDRARRAARLAPEPEVAS